MVEYTAYYDGPCGWCQWWVRFFRRRDKQGRIRFAPLQSAEAGDRHLGVMPDEVPDTLVVVRGQEVWTHSEAAIRLFTALGGGWVVFRYALWVPRPWRDGVYRLIARLRPRRQGEACPLPASGPDSRRSSEGTE